MDGLTRRRFLIASGVTAATALAGGTTAIGWDTLVGRAGTDPLPVGTKILVLITLYGGNDGLNTVVPAADPAYRAARPELAIAEQDALPLGDGLWLNPGLTGTKKLWGHRQPRDRARRQLPAARPQPLSLDGDLAVRSTGVAGQHRLDRPMAGRRRR